MYAEQEDVFYYITCMNENYAHPAMPKGVEAGNPQGHVPAADRRARQGAREPAWARARSCAKCITAAEILERDYGVPADVFSVPSFSELRREALDVERTNLLHPDQPRAAAVRAPVPRRSHRSVHRRHATT